MDREAQTQPISSQAVEAAPKSLDLSGRSLGDFHLLRRLGQGGMGQVYLAEQFSLKRKVAIKIMRPDIAVNATSFQRFRAEAEAVARITHANIVQVYAFGESDGLHYMALEYVEGRNLREYLNKKGPPDVPLALSIMRQAAAALQRASELGIVHRDIKPENILLTRRGEVKVTDFGLSRCFGGEVAAPHLTQSGITMGTPLYMSPEQIQGQEIDPRTDIYSLGVTCYHMLAGRPPFSGQSPFDLALQHVSDEAAPLTGLRPDLPGELCVIIHKMMAKERERRYQTCSELLKDLSRLRDNLAGAPTQASGIPLQPLVGLSAPSRAPIARAAGRQRWLLGMAVLSVVLALCAGGALAWQRSKAKSAVSPSTPIEDSPVAQALTEQQKQEKFLREAVEQYRDPQGNRNRLDLGLRHCLELGLFYLKSHRLSDADDFFTGLINNPNKIEAYKTLGRLGHAIVLARRDRPAESNRAFLEALGEKLPRGRAVDRLPFLLNQPMLRYEIGRALDFNQANAPGELPAKLRELRDPPKAGTRVGP